MYITKYIFIHLFKNKFSIIFNKWIYDSKNIISLSALPQNNPLISSFHSTYRFDDFVQVNCSTDFSSLFTRITWYVNGIKVRDNQKLT